MVPPELRPCPNVAESCNGRSSWDEEARRIPGDHLRTETSPRSKTGSRLRPLLYPQLRPLFDLARSISLSHSELGWQQLLRQARGRGQAHLRRHCQEATPHRGSGRRIKDLRQIACVKCELESRVYGRRSAFMGRDRLRRTLFNRVKRADGADCPRSQLAAPATSSQSSPRMARPGIAWGKR